MANDILRLAPDVRFVADQDISNLRLKSNKLAVLSGSRLSREQIQETVDRIELEGLQPIWDELSEKYKEELS